MSLHKIISDESLRLIQANDMIIFKDQWRFFQLISILLYQTVEFENEIHELSRSYFKQNHKELRFETISEYLLNPSASQFESLNLELISLIFKVKIELYQNDFGLICTIFNHGFKRTIRIFKEDFNYYELQNVQYQKKFKFIKKILLQMMDSLLEINNTKPIQTRFPMGDSVYQHPQLNLVYEHYFKNYGVKSAQKSVTQELTPSKKVLTPQYKPIVDQKQESQHQQSGNQGELNKVLQQKKAQKFFTFKDVQGPAKTVNYDRDEEAFLTQIMKPPHAPCQPQQQQIIASQPQRVVGRLKFFDEAKQFGFFVNEKTRDDIFVHLDDMQKSGIDPKAYKKRLQSGENLYFSFQVVLYQGKSRQNVKAIDIKFEWNDAPRK